jgi:sporulation protein YlmC with PRC-barrel domain
MHLSATSLEGNKVINHRGEDIGKIEDLMIDTSGGKVDYAVLSFGGIMGIGDKLFAVPMERISIDTEKECCVFNVEKERLENAPGFDKDHWPNTADKTWQSSIAYYYRA